MAETILDHRLKTPLHVSGEMSCSRIVLFFRSDSFADLISCTGHCVALTAPFGQHAERPGTPWISAPMVWTATSLSICVIIAD